MLCLSIHSGPHPECWEGIGFSCKIRGGKGFPIGADPDPTLAPICRAISKSYGQY
jgi:hypothetical protein